MKLPWSPQVPGPSSLKSLMVDPVELSQRGLTNPQFPRNLCQGVDSLSWQCSGLKMKLMATWVARHGTRSHKKKQVSQLSCTKDSKHFPLTLWKHKKCYSWIRQAEGLGDGFGLLMLAEVNGQTSRPFFDSRNGHAAICCASAEGSHRASWIAPAMAAGSDPMKRFSQRQRNVEWFFACLSFPTLMLMTSILDHGKNHHLSHLRLRSMDCEGWGAVTTCLAHKLNPLAHTQHRTSRHTGSETPHTFEETSDPHWPWQSIRAIQIGSKQTPALHLYHRSTSITGVSRVWAWEIWHGWLPNAFNLFGGLSCGS